MDLSPIQPFLDWVQNHPALSGFVVFAIAAAESLAVVGILVPGVVFMLGIGALIGLGVLDFWSTMWWAAGGAIVGDGMSYWLGRHFDRQLRSLWPFTKHPDLIPRGERFFHKHGGKSVLFGRFIGPIRPIIPAVAGLMHMNPYHFYFVNILSAIAWAPAVLLPGAVFGSSLHLATEVAGRLVILLLLVVGIAWLLIVGARTLVTPLLLRVFGRWEANWDFVIRNAFNSGVVLLVLVLAGSTYYLYVNIENSRKKLPPITDVQLWWQDAWKKLPAYREKREREDPFTVQWWGTLDTINKDLQKQHWQTANELSLVNAIMWLSPSPQIEALPLWSRRFHGEKQSLLMVRKLDDRRQLIFRLWSAYPNPEQRKSPLWVATLSLMELQETVHKIFYARINSGLSFTEEKFLSVLPTNIIVKKVNRNVTADDWNGEVVLIKSQ